MNSQSASESFLWSGVHEPAANVDIALLRILVCQSLLPVAALKTAAGHAMNAMYDLMKRTLLQGLTIADGCHLVADEVS